MKRPLVLSIAAILAAVISPSVDADVIAFYGNGTDADAAALPNAAAAVAGVTVSDLADVGAQTGDPARITRPSFGTDTPIGTVAGSAQGSEWFEARSTENQGAPSSVDNYFFFTATADAGSALDLVSLRYNWWVSPANDGLVAEAAAEAFISVDGGAFTSVGSVTAIDNDNVGAVAAAPVTANFDLSAITGAQSVEVRVGIGYSQGNSNAISGFAQGFELDANVVSAVPEPGSLSLFGLIGVGLLVRRKK